MLEFLEATVEQTNDVAPLINREEVAKGRYEKRQRSNDQLFALFGQTSARIQLQWKSGRFIYSFCFAFALALERQ